MQLKQLESSLRNVKKFASPKFELEQYPTGPHIASRMLFMAERTYGDIVGKVVADFGCGCGTLAIAASLSEAGQVVGVELDADAVTLAQQNCMALEVEVDLMQANLAKLPWRGSFVDTVVMNPPFGTPRKNVDMEFLSAALKVAGTAVYSLHLSTRRVQVERMALQDFGAKTAEVLCELRYELPAPYLKEEPHVDIAVDIWRFTPRQLLPL